MDFPHSVQSRLPSAVCTVSDGMGLSGVLQQVLAARHRPVLQGALLTTYAMSGERADRSHLDIL